MSPIIRIDSDDLAAQVGQKLQSAVAAAILLKNNVPDDEFTQDVDFFRALTDVVGARALCDLALSDTALLPQDKERFSEMRRRAARMMSLFRGAFSFVRNGTQPERIKVEGVERKKKRFLNDDEKLEIALKFKKMSGSPTARAQALGREYGCYWQTIMRAVEQAGGKN